MQKIYNKYFSLGHLNSDVNTRFALISLICHLTEKLKDKKPDITHYQVIRKISEGCIPEDFIKSLAVICSDYSGYKEYPTFGIEDKKIPAKVKEILSEWTPF